MRLVIGWSVIIGMAALVVWSLWRLAREAKRVHDDLDNLQRRASDCETQEELEDVEVSLRLYTAKNCWHRHFGAHARKVLAYIHGRLHAKQFFTK